MRRRCSAHINPGTRRSPSRRSICFALPAGDLRRSRARGHRAGDVAGRFEVVSRDPLVIVDGGHNPQGAEVLADSLRDLGVRAAGDSRRAVFVMGVLADKDYLPMIRSVAPFARAFVVYAPDNPRALSADDLASAVRSVVEGRRGKARPSRGSASKRRPTPLKPSPGRLSWCATATSSSRSAASTRSAP